MDDALELASTENIYVTVTGKSGQKRSPLDLPVQKSVSGKENLVNEFCKPGDLLVDLSSGTFLTERECLKFLRNCCYFRFKIDAECFAVSGCTLTETMRDMS